MRRSLVTVLLTTLAILAVSCLPWVRTVYASESPVNPSGGDPIASMGGEPIDNLWHFNLRFCTDGLIVSAQQYAPDSTQDLRYSVQLAGVSLGTTWADDPSQQIAPPPGSSLPQPASSWDTKDTFQSPYQIPIAGADHNTSLVRGTLIYPFATAQKAGDDISARIVRLDHAQDSPREDPDDDGDEDSADSDTDLVPDTDGSSFDDILTLSGTVDGSCQVGSIMTMGVEGLTSPVSTVDPFLPDGSNDWFVHTTRITLGVADTASSPGTIATYYSVDNPSCAPGSPVSNCHTYSGPFSVTDSPHTIYFFSNDSAGNVESQQEVLSVNQDTAAPTVTCNAATFVLNQTSAQGSVTVTDTASGLSSATQSSYPFSATTSAVGTFSATTTPSPLTVSDLAGNSARATPSCSYTVTFNAPRMLYNTTAKNSGSSVPIKVQLLDFSQRNVSAASTALMALCVVKQPATTCGSAPMINKPFTFMTFDQGAGYQYNVKTTGLASKTSYYLLYTAGADPSVYRAPFVLG